MKLLKQASLFALSVAAVLAACNRAEKQDVAPTPKIDAKAVGAKWHQRASPAELAVTVQEYKALRTDQMEDFIHAEADAMHQATGQDNLTTEAYRKTRLLLHRLSVEEFGVSYNKISGKQLDQLLDDEQVAPQVEALGALQEKTQRRPVQEQSNYHIVDICYVNYNPPHSGYYCNAPYVLPYNSQSTNAGTPTDYVNQARCASNYGRTRAVNATDCDWHFTFEGCTSYVEGSNWRWIAGETGAFNTMLASDTWPTQTIPTGTPGTVTRVVLLGSNRVWLVGGGGFTARNVRLQRNAQ